ncbi:integral membrane [Trichoderma arundinaceum]|uniref:Integral membrane n=1 Tax=Trichoderma arundinaceum TaxID=490622 RepID=A0A395NY07_TRIAR|nr:integral membrane [Trichoderma arundinaceum]
MQPTVAALRSLQPKGPLSFQSLPAALRPLVRAYLLGYASAVAPRLLTLILQFISKKRRSAKKYLSADRDERSFKDSAFRILRTGLDPRRFPTFCAALVGGSTLLQEPLLKIISRVATQLSAASQLRLARWVSTFISGWLSLQLLQSKRTSPSWADTGLASVQQGLAEASPHGYGGRTLDLTLFAVTRAADVLVGELWSQHRTRRKATEKWTVVEQVLSRLMDPVVFAASSGLIMWAWFYSPDSLPRSYNKWITSAASVDLRLIEALRRCRKGELIYGKETGQAPLLGSMCEDYGLPVEWGDPVKKIPFSCDIVHMGCGSSCEYHAMSRFLRSWRWSMLTYLPLALALQLRNPKRINLMKAITGSTRSSTFLATFITLFYYGVCLGRTRLGPRILGKDIPSRQRIDGGICVGTGCYLCGWSVLIETAGRRKDMALFVAPRALATLVPRRYPLEKQWREKLIFAASTAVVFTCALENPKRVRGVLGGLLGMVLKK